MGLEGYVNYAEQAYKAESFENSSRLLVEKTNILREVFKDGQLSGPDDKHKKNLSENTEKFFKVFGRKYESVEHMENIVNDRNKSKEVKQNAMDDLDLMGKVVYENIRNNKDFETIIGSGSASEIDEKLPNEFKGIGKIVLTNIFEEGPVLEALRDLDSKRAGMNRMPDGGVKREKMVMIMNETVDEIVKLNEKDLTSGQNYDKDMSLAYLGAKIESLMPNELPSLKEEQLRYVRQILEKVESSLRTTRDPNLGQYSATLEEIINKKEIYPEVAIEVRSRLKLHDCSVLMKKANGYIKTPESGADTECPTVGAAATQAEGMNHALDTEAINFFLKTEANELPTAEAWDLYQDININYREILTEMEIKQHSPGKYTSSGLETVVDNDPDMGTIEANYLTDSDPTRKLAVDKYVVEKIMLKKGVDNTTAEKAWLLGKRLALATGENSVFFAALSGNDEMAEDMFLKQYRKGRDKNGRPRGPQIHINKIVGIGNTWLRRASGFEPYDSKGVIPIYSKDIIVVPTGDKEKSGIEEQSYVSHFAVWWSGKIHPLRGLLLERQPEAQKYQSIDFLQTAQDYFKKADPYGSKRLKYYWVAGVLDMACSNGDLGWTQDDISKFRQFLTKRNLSDTAGPFIAMDDWNELMSKGDFSDKMLKLEFKRINQAFLGSSGGRRK